ncbi:MAG: hypothetical protein PHW93_05525 [Candidatus Methanomethylophilaceae archaeon]|nr:hypothetical protein [Candidatus Methanomethylophilaceae archaeon]
MAPPADPMTFEDLTSLYRMEKKSTSLAEARKDLYAAICRLLADIQRDYEKQLVNDPDSIITDGLNERRRKMMDFSQRIVDLRMNKILIMALRGAMGSENPLERLTSEERDFYQSVLADCSAHRGLISSPRRRKEVRIPDILGEEPVAPSMKRDEPKPLPPPVSEGPLEETLQESMAEEERSDLVVIRVTENLPTFSGADRDYDLRKEDVVRMPLSLAMALVNRGKAVLVDVRP